VSHRVTRTDPCEQHDLFRASPIEFVRETLIDFLQTLFSYQPKGSYHWSPDEETDIVIQDEAPVKTEDIGTRPAIALTRAPMRMQTLGLDDMASLDLRTGAKTKAVVVPGTMVMNCCSRVPLESERLAFHAGEHIWILRDVLQKSGFYQIGQDIGYGSPSPAGAIVAGDGADGWYATSVTLPFQVQRTARLTPLGVMMARAIQVRILGLSRTASSSSEEQRYSLEPGVSSSGDAYTPAPSSLTGPGVEPYPDIQRRNGLRAPRIKGRQLPIIGSSVPESSERGLDGPLTVKV